MGPPGDAGANGRCAGTAKRSIRRYWLDQLTVLLSDDIVIVNRIQLGDVPGFLVLMPVYRQLTVAKFVRRAGEAAPLWEGANQDVGLGPGLNGSRINPLQLRTSRGESWELSLRGHPKRNVAVGTGRRAIEITCFTFPSTFSGGLRRQRKQPEKAEERPKCKCWPSENFNLTICLSLCAAGRQ